MDPDLQKCHGSGTLFIDLKEPDPKAIITDLYILNVIIPNIDDLNLLIRNSNILLKTFQNGENLKKIRYFSILDDDNNTAQIFKRIILQIQIGLFRKIQGVHREHATKPVPHLVYKCYDSRQKRFT